MSLFSPHWEAPKRLLLEENQVHIWKVQLDFSNAEISEMMTLFSAQEKERAKQFHFLRDRKHYIATHGALRKVLSLYVNEQPSLLNFYKNK